MKALVLGDPHFGVGYKLGKTHKLRRLNTRLLDFSNTFDYVIDYMISNEIKVLIITGDVFEYRRPRPSELGIFAEKIQRLQEHGIQTHIVAGNHDIIADERTTTMDILQKLKLPGTFVYSDIDSVECKEGGTAMNFVFIPYRTKSILGCTTNNNALERVTERIQHETSKFSEGNNFLIGHFMFKQTMLGSINLEKDADEVVFPTEMFDQCDGTIVGHVHAHQILQSNPVMAYIGSMEYKDFGEADQKKYFVVIDNSSGDVIFQFEELPTRRLHDIKLELSSISDKEEFLVELKKQLISYSEKNDMNGSIVRLSLFVNGSILNDFNADDVRAFLKAKLNVYYCVGIHPFITSSRMLRKASITEWKDPKDSFAEYVNEILISESEDVKTKMLEYGLDIIKEAVK